MRITYAPLRSLMAERGVSFYRLYKDLGFNSQLRKKLRNDTDYVSLQTIDLLCDYFDVDVDRIIKRRS